MKNALVVIACALQFAACNKSPAVHETNASVAEVADKVREASSGNSFIRPGQWASTVTIEEFDMPGVPAQASARVKSAMAENQPHEVTSCLSAEDVKRPDVKFFTGKDQCRYDHFPMGNGKIDAAMRCTGAGGGGQVTTMTGTYSPDRYQMHMAMAGQDMPGGGGAMTMKMRVDSRRVGECTGEDR